MTDPVNLPDFRNITISGRIGSGATTLAHRLSQILNWGMIDGGKLFRELTKDHGYADGRADRFDLDYEEMVKTKLKNSSHQIIQSHLAGFDAQGIEGVLKILLVCEDTEGNDKADIRIDRLVNRDDMPIEEAKREVIEREKQNLEKWQRLYADNDKNWYYWDKRYYDLVISTYSHNPDQTLGIVLEKIGYKV